MLRKSFSAAIALGISVALGCSASTSEPKAIAKGKVVDGGKPYTIVVPKAKGSLPPPPGTESSSGLKIQFTPAEGGDTFSADVDPDTGAFEIKGHDGKGIKPGKYKIILTTPNSMPGMPAASEVFGGKFGREKSQIERDVTVDGPEIVIDVSKPKG